MADPGARWLRRGILACLIAGVVFALVIPQGRIVDSYRGVILVRLIGLFLFTQPLLPLLLVLAIDCRRHRVRFADTPVALWLGFLLVLGVVAMGLFDAGRYEPNLSRRLLPVFLPLLLLAVAILTARRWRATTRPYRAAYLLALLYFGTVSWLHYRPFADYSDYDSLNPTVAAIAALPCQSLVIDPPIGLIDTPLFLYWQAPAVRSDRLTPESLVLLLEHAHDRAAAQGLAPDDPRARVLLLRSSIPGAESTDGVSLTAKLLAGNGVAAAFVDQFELPWEDITDYTYFTIRTVVFPRRHAPHRYTVQVYQLTRDDQPSADGE